MLLNNTHKQKLLKIVEKHPADTALLLGYLEEQLDLLPMDLKGEDQKAVEFFIIRSFADEISNLRAEKKLKEGDFLLVKN